MNVDEITGAYAQESLSVSLDEIQRRGGRWSRRRSAAGIAAATAVAATVATVVMLTGGAAPKDALAPDTIADRNAGVCQREITLLRENGQQAYLPPTAPRLAITDGDAWLRVHVLDGMIYTCSSGSGSAPTIFGTRLPKNDGTLHLTGDLDVVVKAGGLLIGTVPAGTSGIDARLATGAAIRGETDGKIFAVWSPGADLQGAQVTARGADGPLGFATATTEANIDLNPTVLTQFCAQHGPQLLRGHAMPPRRFQLGGAQTALWIYADETAALICTWSSTNGYAVSGPIPAVTSAEPLPWVEIFGDDSWILGRVPSGAERVEIVLPSSQVVPAQISGPFFAAGWTDEQHVRPRKVLVYTADRIYTIEGGATTSVPR
ncbi:effector-binding domain-containing protein [Allocatelliglobosispora scoriae]|uniref:Effector-binding domain-containing protein n=1 Tax=Allocatelliglobosispora scoriae TaxID=643052 RepID=A0A841BUH2_9ACTN|nr:hypothetical protein [Allocatelliglobosispora scoriae]MBB5871098.1 effector-binding domain-containing protein [Allocatelliglobosispora scoriae]